MMNLPLVSVGVASYNNAKYVVETLDSIVNQTYSNIELIIIDDCSIDNSVEVIEDWIFRSGFECKFIKNKKNIGVCGVCNILLENSNGKYYSLVGSDDVFLPDKILDQVNAMESADVDVAVVFSDVYIIDATGKRESLTLFEKSGLDIDLRMSGDIFIGLLKRSFIPAPSVLVKTDIVRSMGGYDENLSYEDWDMWLRITKKYKIHYSAFISAEYRVLETSAWNSRSVKFYESTIQLLTKQLGYSAEGDEIIKSHINENAELIYKNGGASATQWLKQRWQNQRSLTAGMLYTLAALGLPYSAFEALRKLVRA